MDHCTLWRNDGLIVSDEFAYGPTFKARSDRKISITELSEDSSEDDWAIVENEESSGDESVIDTEMAFEMLDGVVQVSCKLSNGSSGDD